MQSTETGLIFSATDLSNFLACPHLTLLSLRAALGGPKPPQFPDPGLDVLRERGHQHELKFLEQLQQSGHKRIIEIADAAGAYGPHKWRKQADETIIAMR